MTEQNASGPEPGTDLEYDLAHETIGTSQEPLRSADYGEVITGTPDYDGDYSYDLAHDIPRTDR